MQLSQLYSFTIRVCECDRITQVRRNSFSKNESDAFIYEVRELSGDVLRQFTIMDSTAELSLLSALALMEKNPGLVTIEFERLTTGTTFNYPVPHI
jgi:acetylglutamate synthase